jgi:hypothetical protein
MLTLAGDKAAAKDAKDIVGLETDVWPEVAVDQGDENRDPVKTYNKVEFAKLAALAPGYDWQGLSHRLRRGRQDRLPGDQRARVPARLCPRDSRDSAGHLEVLFSVAPVVGFLALSIQGLR